MTRDQDIAFVYGTLMQGFPLHRLIDGRAEYLGPGTVAARLIDLGAYPAAVADAHGTVAGEMYRLRDSGLWRALDSVEGPQYHRGEVVVRMADGREVTAFIYWYVGPLDRGVPVPGGDYRAHAPARSIHRRS
ncbi:MAG TPA: gamma-glutamylcyclotransferase family protein [Candidatus Methylomirabilis sp.]|nr:gamma-glutamylcyclotransferase family protein [Candidatus Methylomirabilis sp.]